jgi:hypothetical protein
MTSTGARERQRFDHLVLGMPRPRARPGKRRKPAQPVALAKGVEEHVALREKWSHKQGTPQTHEAIEREQQRPGSMARLLASGAIDKDQLAAADQIVQAYRSIVAGVAVRTASLETRIDGSRHGRAEEEAIGRVHADLAYDWWRAEVAPYGEMLLSVIVHDVGLTIAAGRAGLGMTRARRVLTDALDLWRTGRRVTARRAAAIAG